MDAKSRLASLAVNLKQMIDRSDFASKKHIVVVFNERDECVFVRWTGNADEWKKLTGVGSSLQGQKICYEMQVFFTGSAKPSDSWTLGSAAWQSLPLLTFAIYVRHSNPGAVSGWAQLKSKVRHSCSDECAKALFEAITGKDPANGTWLSDKVGSRSLAKNIALLILVVAIVVLSLGALVCGVNWGASSLGIDLGFPRK